MWVSPTSEIKHLLCFREPADFVIGESEIQWIGPVQRRQQTGFAKRRDCPIKVVRAIAGRIFAIGLGG